MNVADLATLAGRALDVLWRASWQASVLVGLVLIAQWRNELPLQSMSRDMYLTAHDVGAPPKISPKELGDVKKQKKQPLRLKARSASRDQAKTQQRRRQR